MRISLLFFVKKLKDLLKMGGRLGVSCRYFTVRNQDAQHALGNIIPSNTYFLANPNTFGFSLVLCICICCTSTPPDLIKCALLPCGYDMEQAVQPLVHLFMPTPPPPSYEGAFLSALDPRRRKGRSGGTRNRDGKTTQRKERRSAYGDFFSLFFFLEKLGIPVSCCSFTF